MKRMTLWALAMLCMPMLDAQEVKTDSLWADSLVQTLPEVMVVGERPVVRAKAGKLEYDLQRIIEGKPVDNIYDALKQLPGVVEMNGGLTLGARGVTIVLDGKVTNMSTEQLYALLRSMPADRVERVDVMFNAPARYQVRGAMIDVRLRHRIGDPGTVQGEAYGKYDQSHEASFQERASLLYDGGRFSLDFLYSHDHGKGFNTTDKEARHWQEATDETHFIENHEVMRSRSHTHNFRLGADYDIGKDHALSFVYNGAYATSHTRQHTTGTQTATNLSTQTSWLHNGRLDYEAPIGLKAGAEFTWYQAPGDQLLHSEMEGVRMDFYTTDKQRINAWKFFLAQEHALKNGWGLNYGATYTTSVDNSYQYYYNEELRMKNEESVLPPDMRSRRREQTLNLYAGFNKSFGQKWMLDFSLAGERYKTPVWDEWDVYPVLNQQRQELSVLLGSAGRRVLPGRRILRDTGQPAAEARERLPTFAELHLEVEVRFLFLVRPQQGHVHADPLPVAGEVAGDIQVSELRLSATGSRAGLSPLQGRPVARLAPHPGGHVAARQGLRLLRPALRPPYIGGCRRAERYLQAARQARPSPDA